MSIIAREQHTVVIDGQTYLITALEATYGLNVMAQIQSGAPMSGSFIKELIIKSVTINSTAINEKNYELMFSKKYKLIFQLYEEILAFNFGDLSDPNVESDTTE